MTTANVSFPIARRISQFSYAIRNVVGEAKRLEAAGRSIRYLNVGNPPAFGFTTPVHMIEAIERAMRSGENGYGPSAGVEPAREAVAAEYSNRGWPISADRVLVTSGTSEGIELALAALIDPGDDVLVPMPTYPLYTALVAKLDGREIYYPTVPEAGWVPDLDQMDRLVTPRTRALVVIDPNNPTGSRYPTPVRQALLDFAERHSLVVLADEVYGDLGYDGAVPPIGSLDPDAPILSFASLSKGYMAPGWRTGWIGVGRSPRLDDVYLAMKKLADGRLCSTLPMQHAIVAALMGDRTHQTAFRTALRERASITATALSSIPGISCTPPMAAFYAMPKVSLPAGKTDEDYVLSLLRATGILCVHGSGFGMPAADGYFRLVFLPEPDELREIYRLIAEFTGEYLQD